MKSKVEQLQAGLNRKLDRVPKRSISKPLSDSSVPGSGGVERVTLSLHGTDTSRIDELEDYLRTLGHRESNRSLLVKVALRGLVFAPDLVDHLKAAQAEDGRRKK